MLRYPCLVLDHDDTVVQSEATVNYPCFVEFLKEYRPGVTITLETYMSLCSSMSFDGMCRAYYGLNDQEMDAEYRFWKDYVKSHIPAPFPGIRELIHRQRAEGGLVCVASMSSSEIILRDYRTHFDMEPDLIFDCNLPQAQRKPSPYALHKIMEVYGLSPQEILLVDDMKLALPMARAANVPIAFAGWSRQAFPKLMEEMTALCDFSFSTVKDLACFLFESDV